MQENKPNYMEDDEISLKELILKIREYYNEVMSHWKLVALITIPLVAFMLYRAWVTPPTYGATLTFMINEEEGGGPSALTGILGMVGLGGKGGEYNLDKILSLSKSRIIIQAALFEKATIKGKEDWFANHLIREYKYHELWADDTTGLKDFVYTHDSIPAFTRLERGVLKNLHGKIRGNADAGIEGIMVSTINEETGIMNMNINSTSEELSIQLVETIYKELGEYYVAKSIEKQQQTYDIMREKTDSIRNLLDGAQFRLLKFKDTNRNLTLGQYNAEEYRLNRNVQVLTLAYGESLKNQEIADFTLKTKTPFIQAIDYPMSPIDPAGASKIKAIIIGGFLGGFLAVAFILGRKIIRDAMQNDEPSTA